MIAFLPSQSHDRCCHGDRYTVTNNIHVCPAQFSYNQMQIDSEKPKISSSANAQQTHYAMTTLLLRQNDVIWRNYVKMTSFWRNYVKMITSKWRRFDVKTTSLLRHVFRGRHRNWAIQAWWRLYIDLLSIKPLGPNLLKFIKSTKRFVQQNAFESVACRMPTIFFQCHMLMYQPDGMSFVTYHVSARNDTVF